MMMIEGWVVRYMFVYCQNLSTPVSLVTYNGILCFRRISVGYCHMFDMPGVMLTATIAFIASPSANLPWWVLRIVRGSVRVAPTERGDINIYATRVIGALSAYLHPLLRRRDLSIKSSLLGVHHLGQ